MTSAHRTAELPAGRVAIVTGAGDRAHSVLTDVTDPTSIERLVQDTVAGHTRLGMAFNNAGQGHRPEPLADLSVEDFDRTLSASAQGVFVSRKHELSATLDNDPPGGAIVTVASGAGVRGVPGIAGYVAAKHAIVGLTETAALEEVLVALGVPGEKASEEFLTYSAQATRDGMFTARGLPTSPRNAVWIAAFAQRHRHETVMTSPPPAVQRVVLPLLARFAQ